MSRFSERHETVRCPTCFASFKRYRAPYLCTSKTIEDEPCATFLRELDVARPEFRKRYRKAFNVDLAPMIGPGGPWVEASAGQDNLAGLRFLPSAEAAMLGLSVRCPRCRARESDADILRVCPECGNVLNMNVFMASANARSTVGMVGLRSSGKTCLLAAWMSGLFRRATCLQSDLRLRDIARELSRPGSTLVALPPATVTDAPFVFQVLKNDRVSGIGTQRHLLHLQDLPGEGIQDLHQQLLLAPEDLGGRQLGVGTRSSQLFLMKRLSAADRLCVVVDAMNVRDSAADGAGLLAAIDLARQRQARGPDGLPAQVCAVAICVTKIDTQFTTMPKDMPSPEECESKARKLLEGYGRALMDQALVLVGNDKDRRRVFGVSALGKRPESIPGMKTAEGKDVLGIIPAIEPIGVDRVIDWLAEPFAKGK